MVIAPVGVLVATVEVPKITLIKGGSLFTKGDDVLIVCVCATSEAFTCVPPVRPSTADPEAAAVVPLTV
jgi:hypothetical protein